MPGSPPDIGQPWHGLYLLPQDRLQLKPLLLLGYQGEQSFWSFARGSDKEEGEPFYKEEECPKEG